MSQDPTARRLAPPSLSSLLLLLLLSRVGALRPDELFPYGESRGDQLLLEGDDESSAAVKLAVPLHFYDAQFNDLYVSSAPGGARLGVSLVASSRGVHEEKQLVHAQLWSLRGPDSAVVLQLRDPCCSLVRIISQGGATTAPFCCGIPRRKASGEFAFRAVGGCAGR